MTSTTDGRRGPYAKTEQFRLDVLDAALGLVAAHGFDAATLQLIADEVGQGLACLERAPLAKPGVTGLSEAARTLAWRMA